MIGKDAIRADRRLPYLASAHLLAVEILRPDEPKKRRELGLGNPSFCVTESADSGRAKLRK